MSRTFLADIVAVTRERIDAIRRSVDIELLRRRATDVRSERGQYLLSEALSETGSANIIAEIKRASPSKGPIRQVINLTEVVKTYESGGACAISVLTEEKFFKGSIADLSRARSITAIPILQKDFIVDEIQILEAAAAGADAILLIVAALERKELEELYQFAIDELGMDVVVEVHSEAEMDTAHALEAKIVGVNNRDLMSFNVSLETSRQLIAKRRQGTLMISESGITNANDIKELHCLGFDGFLVGEALMRSDEPGSLLQELVSI